MIVAVRLFARARDLAGADLVRVELREGATVADLRRGLGRQCPALTSLLEKSALAVDNEFARENQPLTPGAEVALIPPVSGGEETDS
jgi:molybdopterin converting factor subunit 1